jgi:hypothetical protein
LLDLSSVSLAFNGGKVEYIIYESDDTKITDAENTDAKNTDAENNDNENNDADNAKSETTDSKTPDTKTINQESTDTKTTNPESTNTKTAYENFLSGNIEAIDSNNGNQEVYIKDLLESESAKYLYCDIDDDSINELHIRSDKFYFALKYIDASLKVIYEGTSYEYPYHGKDVSGFLYYRPGSAPVHDNYRFISFRPSGEIKEELAFEWYDDNEDGIMGKEDIFIFGDDEDISMSEWKQKTEKYRSSNVELEEWSSLRID